MTSCLTARCDNVAAIRGALGFPGFALIVDILVKERLTGAIILVALIVVLVPELLSGPIRPAARAHGPASSAEEPPLRSYTIDLADESHGVRGPLEMQPASSPSPPGPTPHTESATAPPPAPSTSAPPAPAPRTSAAPPAAAPPAAATPAAPASGGAYVVQLGSFASRANAERLAAQVRGLGFLVSVSRGTAGRRLYRVQVGPARDRAAAEQTAAKLAAAGHAGSVVPK